MGQLLQALHDGVSQAKQSQHINFADKQLEDESFILHEPCAFAEVELDMAACASNAGLNEHDLLPG